jgi:para-aminobenzoate synthetase/4-amino-4-deoxychorismate lyase
VDSNRFQVILRTPWRGPWRRFSGASRVVVARTAAEVRGALADVDRAVSGGSYAAGFVCYEAAAAFGLAVSEPDESLPLVAFGIFDAENAEPLYRPPRGDDVSVGDWTSSLPHNEYVRGVAAIKRAIQAGDTYQINYTFRLDAAFSGDVLALMRRLFIGQRGGWSALIDTGSHVICSASPELFFAVEGDRIVSRPMKGTWPRGYWPEQDEACGEALRNSDKNRAENIMIVDMMRNDLGRVAVTGSVKPSSLFDVERYPLQWQMTSTVEARVVRPRLEQLFEALFPCASITGAPKHRSMEIIRDLETTPRGVYTGAIGYASPNGRAHFNVAIRTAVVDRAAGRARFGVGSGIVWDSVDHDEYDECLLKARMLVVGTGSDADRVVGPHPAADAAPARPRPARTASYAIDDPPGFRLLETMLWTQDRGFVLLDRHLWRLRESAACFGFQCDLEEVRALLSAAVQDLRGPARVRLMLEDDGDALCEAVDLLELRLPLEFALAEEPVRRDDVFLYHKTTRRGLYERARASRPGADTVILWNEEEQVTEGTEANVVVLRDGVKVTPAIECGVLPGTLRAELLESGEIVEGVISRDELLAARDIWLINSVRGWMKAVPGRR